MISILLASTPKQEEPSTYFDLRCIALTKRVPIPFDKDYTTLKLILPVTITENTLQVGSLKWFYREATPLNDRQTTPALFLHGLPAHSYIWREILPQVAEVGFRAIAPDWIGSGFSDKPDKRNFAYSPAAFLNALGELIRGLIFETIEVSCKATEFDPFEVPLG